MSTSSLIVFLGVVLSGSVGLGLAGVAAHHGWISLLSVWGFGLLGKWVRRASLWRLRHRAATEQPTLSATLGHAIKGGSKSTVLVFIVPLLGYAWAHLTQLLPTSLRWTAPVALLAAAGWVLRHKVPKWPPTPAQWHEVYTLARKLRLQHVGWLALGAVWLTPSKTPGELLAKMAEKNRMHVDLDSLQWVDEPYRGVRTTFTSARALVLIARPDIPSDVFLVRFGLSHDGVPARVVGMYNVSNTAAVAETELKVWQRWAAWLIRHEDVVQSIELADLRHEPSGRGEGWTRTKRLQQLLTNRQQTGQWRGIGRARIELLARPKEVELRLHDGLLSAAVSGRELSFDLGRTPAPENLGASVTYTATPSVLPGAFVPWLVDRLRSLSWIGSERLQWLKAWAFRAGEQLENLEHQVVGIDPHEAVSEELGDVLESLPLAEPGQLPGWPPAAIEPPMKPSLTGEGKWVTLAEDILVPDSPGVASPFVFTFIRTEPERAYIQTSITLWDPRQVELHIVAGTEEPKSMTGELGTGTMVREPQVLSRVVAAFNGAFQAVHGEFGMMERGRVQLPPKPYAATVATSLDGVAGFGTWPANTPIPSDFTAFRQNLTPLVLDGQLNPYRRTWWGGVPEGWTEESRTVRSGLCLTVEGYMAYFYSPGITPDALGKAMLHARCSYGIHLDMNAGHTGFEFYRIAPRGQLPQLSRPLDRVWEAQGDVADQPGWSFFSRLMVRKMALMNFPRYIDTVSRDFFYLTRRSLLPGPELTPLPGGEADTGNGKWRIPDIDGVGFPHAVAITALSLPDEGRARIVRIDPKQLQATQRASNAHFGIASAHVDEGRCIWHRQRSFVSSDAALGADASLTLCGSSSAGSSAAFACIDAAGMLMLLQTQPPSPLPKELLSQLESRLDCQTSLYLEDPAQLLLEDDSKGSALRPSAQSGTPGSGKKPVQRARQAGERSNTPHDVQLAWFIHNPQLGASRIFVDTPVLPPNDWALLQRRRVEYVATPENKPNGVR